MHNMSGYQNADRVKLTCEWVSEFAPQIDHVGIQVHASIETFRPRELEASFQTVFDYGFQPCLTELTIWIYYACWRKTPIKKRLDQQAQAYLEACQIAQASNSPYVGFTSPLDQGSFVNHPDPRVQDKECAGLWDRNLEPKPALITLIDNGIINPAIQGNYQGPSNY